MSLPWLQKPCNTCKSKYHGPSDVPDYLGATEHIAFVRFYIAMEATERYGEDIARKRELEKPQQREANANGIYPANSCQ